MSLHREASLRGAIVAAAAALLAGVSCGQSVAGEGARGGSGLRLEQVAGGLNQPLYLCSQPGDATRLYVLEKTGLIRVIEGGALRDEPALDLREKIDTKSERGLLGMAFHPRWPERPFVFLNYTDLEGTTHVSRFRWAPDSPRAVDPATEKVLLTVEQPWANHNAGMLAFGPDGYLYVGTGDGGSGGDPRDAAQDGASLLGKMLRIDVDGGDPYGIPEDNPFVGEEDGFRDEIWAYGLRNPWRYCFDPANGDLYIGDVGQNAWEEVHWEPGGNPGGRNYGWRLYEGNHEFKPVEGVGREGLSWPVHEYPQGGEAGHCSVTGGYVYRGKELPAIAGHYFFGDYCSGKIGSFRVEDGRAVERTDWSEALDPGDGLEALVSFGVDADGRLYVLELTGTVWRIVAAGGGTGASAAD